jgi:hypothetical protein
MLTAEQLVEDRKRYEEKLMFLRDLRESWRNGGEGGVVLERIKGHIADATAILARIDQLIMLAKRKKK